MSITHIPWNTDGLCGAACAQMVLSSRYLMGTSAADQDNLWQTIKKRTRGGGTQACCVELPVPFDNMKRENCPGQGCAFCWETFPTVLRGVLVSAIGKGTQVRLRQSASQDTANTIIRDCLSRGGAPIVLIRAGQHWLIVNGWDTSVTPNIVSILDPADDQPVDLTLTQWNDNRMVAVDCGRYDGKYVVVEVG